jgi:hypothetical protein
MQYVHIILYQCPCHDLPIPPFQAPRFSLNASSLNARGRVLHITRHGTTLAHQTLHKRLRDGVRALWARVRVIIGIVRVHGGDPQRLEDVGRVLAMVDELDHRASRGGGALAIAGEATGSVGEGAGLPGVVGRRRREDNVRAFGGVLLGGVDQVGRVSEDCLGDTVVGRLASLTAGAVAVSTAVVGGCQGATVVVAKLYPSYPLAGSRYDSNSSVPEICALQRHVMQRRLIWSGDNTKRERYTDENKVARNNLLSNRRETTFACVAARGAACYRIIHNRSSGDGVL